MNAMMIDRFADIIRYLVTRCPKKQRIILVLPRIRPRSLALIFFMTLTPLAAIPASAEEVGGQLEPYSTLEIAAPEPGIVKEVFVREGDRVVANQVVVQMDDSVLRASLAVAEQARQSRGNIDSALADLRIRESLHSRLEPLIRRGSASREEFDRAISEVELARARVVSAQEELQIRELEHNRILVELERRQLRSQISGVVVTVDRDPGEYVSPSNPVVVTVVQLDVLKAVMLIPRTQSLAMRAGQNLDIVIGFNAKPVTGIIEFVSPMTEPGGNDVEIKVKIDNAEGKYQAGDRCNLASAALMSDPNRPRLQIRQLPKL